MFSTSGKHIFLPRKKRQFLTGNFRSKGRRRRNAAVAGRDPSHPTVARSSGLKPLTVFVPIYQENNTRSTSNPGVTSLGVEHSWSQSPRNLPEIAVLDVDAIKFGKVLQQLGPVVGCIHVFMGSLNLPSSLQYHLLYSQVDNNDGYLASFL